MGEVLLYTLSLVLGIFVPAKIVRRDVARLGGEPLSRSWPDSSLWLAVVLIGPFSVPLHYLRTRRNLRGVGLALLWFALAFALVVLPVWLLGEIFGVGE